MKIQPKIPDPPPDSDESRLVDKKTVAFYLGLCERSIENLQKQGLPHYRLGSRRNRYRLAEVREWLARTHRVA